MNAHNPFKSLADSERFFLPCFCSFSPYISCMTYNIHAQMFKSCQSNSFFNIQHIHYIKYYNMAEPSIYFVFVRTWCLDANVSWIFVFVTSIMTKSYAIVYSNRNEFNFQKLLLVTLQLISSSFFVLSLTPKFIFICVLCIVYSVSYYIRLCLMYDVLLC